MSFIGTATRTAGRFSPWARAIAVAEIAMVAKRHIERLGDGEGTEMRHLVTKSKGRPGNLTAQERSRLIALVRKMEPGVFAKSAAMKAVPLRRR